MSREHLKTPKELIDAEFGHVMDLFARAIPGPSDRATFRTLMNEANAKGLNWVEGLEYAAAKHRVASEVTV